MNNILRPQLSLRAKSVRVKAALLLGGLIAVNVMLWLLTGRAAIRYGFLLDGSAHSTLLLTGGAAWLAYGFGLRHAVDADHIAAIDNATRRIMQDGRRPVGVGFFFSLGHSTVVFLLCIGLALSAAYVQAHLPQWKSAGAVAGAAISALFLYVIGFVNLIALGELARNARRGRHDKAASDAPLGGSGLLSRLLRPLLRLIDHSWQMYFVGFLFGLGFDTATEVGMLTLSARTGQAGLPLWVLLLPPALFAAAMCLVDTLDGILMLGAYGWAFLKPARKIFYNLSITLLSTLVAFVIGTNEILQILPEKFSGRGQLRRFLDSLQFDSLQFDNLGFVIVGIFGGCWVLAMLVSRHRALAARRRRQKKSANKRRAVSEN